MSETVFGILVMVFLTITGCCFVLMGVTMLIEAINDYRDREEKRKKKMKRGTR